MTAPLAEGTKRRTSCSLSCMTTALPRQSAQLVWLRNAMPEVAMVEAPEAHVGARYALAARQPAGVNGVAVPV